VPEGAVIVKEGDYANTFMAIEEGTARVTRDGEHVGDLGAGDIFGEVGVIEKERRSATVEATSRVKLNQDRALGASADEEEASGGIREDRPTGGGARGERRLAAAPT